MSDLIVQMWNGKPHTAVNHVPDKRRETSGGIEIIRIALPANEATLPISKLELIYADKIKAAVPKDAGATV